MLYELLSGQRAFQRENAIATMAAILHTEPAPLDAPAALQQIVKRCLAKQPAQRFQTMAEVKAALKSSSVTARAGATQPSIAVLPFANMGADKENEYFSDGLAEEIINVLAQIPGLKVTARTSAFAFRGKEQDIRKIAEALDVQDDSRRQRAAIRDRIRVTAQLINAAGRLSSLVAALRPRDGGPVRLAGRNRAGHRVRAASEAFRNARAVRAVQTEPARV